MLTLSPTTRFVIGIFITAAIGISAGTVHLTHAVPDGWIPAIVAWSGIIAFIGSAIQTGLQGLGMSTVSKVAAANADPDIKQVVTTKEIANSPAFKDSDKVVSKS